MSIDKEAARKMLDYINSDEYKNSRPTPRYNSEVELEELYSMDYYRKSANRLIYDD